MSKPWRKTFHSLLIILATLFPVVQSARAESVPSARVYSLPSAMSQINSVSELRDVSPTDWAYEALRSLGERYGCIVGYPDQTYRGRSTLSRGEFAAGLNACLNVMEKLLQENVAIPEEDLNKLNRLAQEFKQELAALSVRVDNLEARTAFLEDHQFSTTTKLNVQTIFNLDDAWGGDRAVPTGQNPSENVPVNTQTNLGYRIRMNFNTSFTGKDLLQTRIQAANIGDLENTTGSPSSRLVYDANTNNDAQIDNLIYQFPIGKTRFYIGANAFNHDDFFELVNPFLSDNGNGSLSRVNRINYFSYPLNVGGAGAGVRHEFSPKFKVSAFYSAVKGNDPSPGQGLFNGSFSSSLQLDFFPTDNLQLAFNYNHSYINSGSINIFGVGSSIANNPFNGAATTLDSYSLLGTWRISNSINIAAWVGYGSATGHSSDISGISRKGDGADLWTWNTNISFVDLGKEKAVLNLAVTMAPYAPFVEDGIADRNPPYVIQLQYLYPINDAITITPGTYVILNPQGNSDNSEIWVGVLRTVFQF